MRLVSAVAALGLLAAVPCGAHAQEGHPEPRVIVDVLRVAGPHDRAAIEREARRLLWGKIVGCYRPAQQKRPKLHGEAVFEFRAGSQGAVSGLRKLRATMPDEDVISCWAKHVRELPLPSAGHASDVVMQIHVAPGDAPPG